MPTDALGQALQITFQAEVVRETKPFSIEIDLKRCPIADALPCEVKSKAALDGEDVDNDTWS